MALLLGLLATAVPGYPAWGQDGAEVDDDAGEEDGLVVLGKLPVPPNLRGVDLLLIDGDARVLYAQTVSNQPVVRHFVSYDLRAAIPQPLRSEPIDFGGTLMGLSSNAVAHDPGRERMYLLVSSGTANIEVVTVDLAGFEVVERWPINSRLPGFTAYGLTYSAADDRLYLLGEWDGGDRTAHYLRGSAFTPLVGVVPSVAALEAASGDVAWVRPVPQCVKPLDNFGGGGTLMRSRHHDALYFMCAAAETKASGLIRLGIAPDATAAQAADFPVEFFPVSGRYTGNNLNTTGIAVFDPVTDRVFAQSQNKTTPGAFVFDGRLSAWVGFVSSPGNNNFFGAVNTGTGKYYQGGFDSIGNDGFLLVTDGRGTPPPQGTRTFDLHSRSLMLADPGSNRVIVPHELPDSSTDYLVVEDHTPDAPPLPALDYDDLTDDVEEGADTSAWYAGNSNGFGAAVTQVGGLEDSTRVTITGADEAFIRILGLSFGHRGFTTATVEGVDVGSFGVSADAQAFSIDEASEADRRRVRENFPGEGDPSELPYSTAFCDEPEARTDAAGLGKAEVRCDEERSSASASYGDRIRLGGEAGPGVSVGWSRFDTVVHRDAEAGSLSETVAAAGGFEVSVPGAGTLSIGEAATVVRTGAAGRTGTASARWTRSLSGIVVRDPAGAVVVGPVGCVTVVDSGSADPAAGEAGEPSSTAADSCGDVFDDVTRQLAARVQVRLPLPEVTATAGGAFAQVRRTEADFLQGLTMNEDDREAVPAVEVTVATDGSGKSRLVVELAAVRANSIYTITQAETFDEPVDDMAGGLDFDVPDLGDVGGEIGDEVVGGIDGLVDSLVDFLADNAGRALDEVVETGLPALPDAASSADVPDLPADPGLIAPPAGPSQSLAFDVDVASSAALDLDAEEAPQVASGDQGDGGFIAESPYDARPIGQVGGLVLLARPVAEAVLVGGVWALFALALLVVGRRLALVAIASGATRRSG